MSDQPPTNQIDQKAASWTAAFCHFGAVFVLLLTILTVAGYLGRWGHYFDLTVHFRLHYALIALGLLIPVLLCRKWVWAFIALMIVGLNGWHVLPQLTTEPTLAPQSNLKVMQINVLSSNQAHDLLFDVINAEKPDLLVVQEVTSAWLEALTRLDDQYPHKIARGRTDNFGIALFSRLPLETAEIRTLGEADVPSIVASVMVERQLVRIVATHSLPPINSDLFWYRNQQLEVVAQTVQDVDLPTLLIGDLNVTPASVYFDEFIQVSGLWDTRSGFGLTATWPAVLGPLGIPIDHCLVSDGIEVHDLRIGPDIQSDHLPLIVELWVKQ